MYSDSVLALNIVIVKYKKDKKKRSFLLHKLKHCLLFALHYSSSSSSQDALNHDNIFHHCFSNECGIIGILKQIHLYLLCTYGVSRKKLLIHRTLIISLKPFVTIVKRMGASGSSCLRPLYGANSSNGLTFTSTEI